MSYIFGTTPISQEVAQREPEQVRTLAQHPFETIKKPEDMEKYLATLESSAIEYKCEYTGEKFEDKIFSDRFKSIKIRITPKDEKWKAESHNLNLPLNMQQGKQLLENETTA